MARKVDPKRTRKALRIVRKLAAKAAAPETIDPETGEIQPGASEVNYSHVDYSDWENAFLSEVDKRLQKYGSAFHNLSKGGSEEALSMLQTQKLKEIAAKASGKKRKGLSSKKPLTTKKPLGWKRRQRA